MSPELRFVLVMLAMLIALGIAGGIARGFRNLRRREYLPEPNSLALRGSQRDFQISERTGARYS